MNYKVGDFCFEPASKAPSMTVPDQSYTIAEILAKFTNHIPPQISKSFYYESDQGDIDFDSFDPTNSPSFDLADFTNHVHDLRNFKDDSSNSIQPPQVSGKSDTTSLSDSEPESEET